MSNTTQKPEPRYPKAKYLTLIFAVVALIGIGVESPYRTGLGDAVVFIGVIGFLASGLLAIDKKSVSQVSSTSSPTGVRYTKSPAQIAQEDRIRGYTVIGVSLGILAAIGITMSIWESRENDKVAKEFVASHANCRYSVTRLLQYLSAYNKQVDAINLAVACGDLANGTHSFQPISTSPPPTESPTEMYQPIRVVSSSIEHTTVLQNYCVASFEWEGTRYTVERQQHIWPFDCEVLQNDKLYFARWASEKHDEFLIGALKAEIVAKQQWPESIRERHLENVLTYTVRRWSNQGP